MGQISQSSLVWILLLVIGYTNAQFRTTYTNGVTGEQCGKHRCLSGVPCVNGRCLCPIKGLGTFVCHANGFDICLFKNDPMITGMDGSHTELPAINRVLLSHMVTSDCSRPVSLRSRPSDLGSLFGLSALSRTALCDIKAYSFGRKKQGKTYISGLEVYVMVIKDYRVYNHATRIITEIDQNGFHKFQETGNQNFWGNPPFTGPVITDIEGFGTIGTTYDTINNFAVVNISSCGAEAGIRGAGFGKYESNADQVPGIFLKVNRHCGPQYLNINESTCAPPYGLGLSIKEQCDLHSQFLGRKLSHKDFMLGKSLTGTAFQKFEKAAPVLTKLSETARECDALQRQKAITLCRFIVDIPLFHNCWDPVDEGGDGEQALELFNKCIFSICDFDAGKCRSVKMDIMAKPHCIKKLTDKQIKGTIIDPEVRCFFRKPMAFGPFKWF